MSAMTHNFFLIIYFRLNQKYPQFPQFIWDLLYIVGHFERNEMWTFWKNSNKKNIKTINYYMVLLKCLNPYISYSKIMFKKKLWRHSSPDNLLLQFQKYCLFHSKHIFLPPYFNPTINDFYIQLSTNSEIVSIQKMNRWPLKIPKNQAIHSKMNFSTYAELKKKS